MNFQSWLSSWLAHHPLKDPTGHDPEQYTQQVMQRVRDANLSPKPWTAWQEFLSFFSIPRATFALAGVGLVAVILFLNHAINDTRLANMETTVDLIAAMGETLESINGEEGEILAQDLEALDTLVLAEATETDEQWLQETLRLLQLLDEDAGSSEAENPSEGDLIDDLQILDEKEIAASS
ncbi:MAG: hypothetical protein HYT88_05330 [Candidatus Omnitrophica bacterium]|nr:hypothetical protein [Candidatus Omnitrophota bacterium]